MPSTRTVRRVVVALVAFALPVVVVPGTADAALDTDSVRLIDGDVDFGNNTFVLGAPLGSGSVVWDVVAGYYTPRLIGTIHLDGAAGKYARMHISYWDGGGAYMYTRHGGTVHASDNLHHHWSVDLSPSPLMQITEAHVCTEISTDNVHFDTVDCVTEYLN